MRIVRISFGLIPVLMLAACATATLSAPDAAPPPVATAAEEITSVTMELLLARLDAGTLRDEPKVVARMLRGRNYRPKYSDGEREQCTYEGTILAANDDEDMFLISVGSKQCVRTDDCLVVFRGSEVVGFIVVDCVFSDKASGVVLRSQGKAMKKPEIRVGDGVISAL